MKANLEEVAKRIVHDALRLNDEDALLVHSYEHMLPLAKEVVKAARRAGADTILTAEADDVWYDAVTSLPTDWLKEPSGLQQAVRRAITAEAWFHGPEDPGLMKTIPQERWRANEEGAMATYRPFEDDPVPSLGLGLSSVTQARAKTYGFDYEKWYDTTVAAMAVETQALKQTGKAVSEVLAEAREGRVTSPNGTDFAFEFHGTPPMVWAGEVRPKKGVKSSYFAFLPAGSVGIALKQGSGEGRLVAGGDIPQVGEFIRGLTWEFEGGRLTKVDAKENPQHFELFWTDEKKEKGADQLGALIVGLNPAAAYGYLDNSIVAGCVSVILGDNESLGGTNHCEFDFPLHLRDATLTVDGTKVVEKGRLEV